jgi:hypothetical protein
MKRFLRVKMRKMESLEVLSKFEEDTKWFIEHYDELKEEFDGEWVAVFDKQVVDNDVNLDRLIGRLEVKYPTDFRNMVLEFVTKKKIEMIL